MAEKKKQLNERKLNGNESGLNTTKMEDISFPLSKLSFPFLLHRSNIKTQQEKEQNEIMKKTG